VEGRVNAAFLRETGLRGPVPDFLVSLRTHAVDRRTRRVPTAWSLLERSNSGPLRLFPAFPEEACHFNRVGTAGVPPFGRLKGFLCALLSPSHVFIRRTAPRRCAAQGRLKFERVFAFTPKILLCCPRLRQRAHASGLGFQAVRGSYSCHVRPQGYFHRAAGSKKSLGCHGHIFGKPA